MVHVTDYDVWHEEEEAVTVSMVIERLLANVQVSKQAIVGLVPTLPATRSCACADALSNAIITPKKPSSIASSAISRPSWASICPPPRKSRRLSESKNSDRASRFNAAA